MGRKGKQLAGAEGNFLHHSITLSLTSCSLVGEGQETSPSSQRVSSVGLTPTRLFLAKVRITWHGGHRLQHAVSSSELGFTEHNE